MMSRPGMDPMMKVLAAAAHPDDIEFMMAGTLLLLKDAGCEIHMWNLANGYCGTATLPREERLRLRWREAQASARCRGDRPSAAVRRPRDPL